MDELIVIKTEALAALLEKVVRKVLSETGGDGKDKEPEIMNAKEAAAFLNISLSTLYAKTSQRLIPHTKQGGLYFKRSELIRWLEQSKKVTRAEVEKGYLLQPKNSLKSA